MAGLGHEELPFEPYDGKVAVAGGVHACMWVLVGVLVLAAVLGLVGRARQAGLRDVRAGSGYGAEPGAESLLPALNDLGATPGERATLLQFSSAFCAPCRATKRILSDV